MNHCFWCGKEVGRIHATVYVAAFQNHFTPICSATAQTNTTSGFARSPNLDFISPKENEMLQRTSLLLLALLASSISYADERFPTGVLVETQALFCVDKTSAQTIADNKGVVPEILITESKCLVLSGAAIYVKEVYRNGDWSVWELTSRNIPAFYEATNWKPIPNGVEI